LRRIRGDNAISIFVSRLKMAITCKIREERKNSDRWEVPGKEKTPPPERKKDRDMSERSSDEAIKASPNSQTLNRKKGWKKRKQKKNTREGDI